MADKTYRYTFQGFNAQEFQLLFPAAVTYATPVTETSAETIEVDVTTDEDYKADLDSFMRVKGFEFKEEVV